MGSPTTNYSWTKPTIGGDANTWGSELNTDLDGIDSTVFGVSGVANAALPKAGGTMTGAVTLQAGSTGAGGAPAYFQAGSLLSAVAAHAFEWDGASLYVTQSSGPTRKTIAYTDSALSGNTTGSAAKLTTARNIAMTGDVAWNVNFDGSGNVTAAGTIGANAVTNAKAAQMAAKTVKGNNTGSTANSTDVDANGIGSALATLLGLAASATGNSGSFQIGSWLVQFGDGGSCSGNGSLAVTYPSAFGTKTVAVAVTSDLSSGFAGASVSGTNASGFTFRNPQNVATNHSYWIAVGY